MFRIRQTSFAAVAVFGRESSLLSILLDLTEAKRPLEGGPLFRLSRRGVEKIVFLMIMQLIARVAASGA